MAITPKSEDTYVEKCSTAQSFIRTEMSTYRIGTLMKNHGLEIHSDKIWADIATKNTLKYLTTYSADLPNLHIWDIWKKTLIGCPYSVV